MQPERLRVPNELSRVALNTAVARRVAADTGVERGCISCVQQHVDDDEVVMSAASSSMVVLGIVIKCTSGIGWPFCLPPLSNAGETDHSGRTRAWRNVDH